MIYDAIILSIFNILSGFFNYLYQIFMGKYLEPSEYGVLIPLLTLYYILSFICNVITTNIIPQISKLNTVKNFDNIYFLFLTYGKEYFILSLSVTVILIVISPFLSCYLHILNRYLMIIIITTPFLFILSVNLSIIQGMQKFKIFGICNIIITSAKLILGFLLVYLGGGLFGALVAVFISTLVGCVISLIMIVNILKHYSPKYCDYKYNKYINFKYNIIVFIILFTYVMITNIDIILIKHYLSDYFSGIYSSLCTLGKIIFFLPGGLSSLVLSKSVEYGVKGDNPLKVLVISIIVALAITFPMIILYIIFPDTTILILFNENYLKASPYLSKYGIVALLFSLSGIVLNYLIAFRIYKVVFPLLLVLLCEIILILLFHSNLDQIINILLLISLLSLTTQIPFIIIHYWQNYSKILK